MANDSIGQITINSHWLDATKAINQYHYPDWETLDKSDATPFGSPFPVMACTEFDAQVLGPMIDSITLKLPSDTWRPLSESPGVRLLYEWSATTLRCFQIRMATLSVFQSESHLKHHLDRHSTLMRVYNRLRVPHVTMDVKFYRELRRTLPECFGGVETYIKARQHIWRVFSFIAPIPDWHVPAGYRTAVRPAKVCYLIPPSIPNDLNATIELLRFESETELYKAVRQVGRFAEIGQPLEEIQCYADTKSST